MKTIGIDDFDVQVIRSRRKTAVIEITGRGEVVVKVPLLYSTWDIKRMVHNKEAWIRQHLKVYEDRKANLRPFTPDEIKRMTKLAKATIPDRVEYYARIMGLTYNRIAIRSQKTKWGSCSSKGNLNFNCLLTMVPGEVMDYVIVHELSHLQHMNHSKDFWAVVASVDPDYKKHRKWLKDNGGVLIARMVAGREIAE